MIHAFFAVLGPALLLQAAPPASASAEPPAVIRDLAQLPISEATGPRCAVAFAAVGQWQAAGEARGAKWPDMAAAGGREFFVQMMAALMDKHGLDREALTQVVVRERERMQQGGDEQIAAMMPACLMFKQAAGL
jgi:hypothetical protein